MNNLTEVVLEILRARPIIEPSDGKPFALAGMAVPGIQLARNSSLVPDRGRDENVNRASHLQARGENENENDSAKYEGCRFSPADPSHSSSVFRQRGALG